MKKYITCFFSILALAFVLYGCAGDEEIVINDAGEETDFISDESGNVSGTDVMAEAETEAGSIFVYLVGAVNKPGVYEVPEGTRIFQVVDSAGGLREDAAAEALNLAAVLQDGAVIRVPDREEYEPYQAQNGTTRGDIDVQAGVDGSGNCGLININTASVSELTTLNGIGESRAEAIVKYREENGAFGCIEDIKNVSGIKDGLFSKIRDKITV
ncbi:MAG: helix-hairpin-helix domain-containing protein [Lachnospiraceae bacterium]|nr:helix-hairpin-helix domain-containing protein [Lachnospiraceae bacterium]